MCMHEAKRRELTGSSVSVGMGSCRSGIDCKVRVGHVALVLTVCEWWLFVLLKGLLMKRGESGLNERMRRKKWSGE